MGTLSAIIYGFVLVTVKLCDLWVGVGGVWYKLISSAYVIALSVLIKISWNEDGYHLGIVWLLGLECK